MSEPIAIIPKNASEEIRIDLSEYNGHKLAGIRTYYDAGGGDWRPTKKGLTVKVSVLSDVISGLRKAQAAALEKGWK